MSEPEQDQDYSAASAPHGFQFGGAPGGAVLNAVEADEFPAASDEAISGLLWLGYLSEDFELFGHRFVIRTLTRGDRLAASLLTKEWEETLGLADAYQTATVAASLMAVDGQPIAELSPSANRQATIRATFTRVQEWYEPVIESLFERVTLLNGKQLSAFTALRSKS